MALNVEAAKLINRVVYTTDFKSLQAVKKQMQDLQKGFKGMKPLDTTMSARSSINNAKKAGQEQAKAYTQGFNDTVKKDINKTSTITRPAKSSAFNSAPLGYDPEAEYARAEAAQTRFYENQRIAAARVRKEESKGKEQTKEDLAQQARSQDAYYKEMIAVANINKLNGLSNEQKDEAIVKSRNLLDQYDKQKLSLKGVNTEMQLMLNEYKQLNAEQLKLNASIRREEQARAKAEEKSKSSFLREEKNNRTRKEQENYWNRRYAIGMLPGVGAAAFGAWGLGAAALVGGGYAGVSAVQGSVKRNQELTQASRQSGYSTATIQAISQSALEHGLENFNVPKIADAVKDMNDKIGDFVNNATLQTKGKNKGLYTGGGGLTDTANVLQLSKDDIAKFQNDPLGMVNLIVNRGKQLGLTQAQVTNLLESFGNDFSRLSYLFDKDGKALTDRMSQLADDGYVLSDAQREQIQKLKDFGVTLGLASDSLADHFTLGLADAVGGVDGFKNALKDLNPLMESLGNWVGEAINHFADLVNFFNSSPWETMKNTDYSLGAIYGRMNDTLNQFIFGENGAPLSSGNNSPISSGLFSSSQNMWNSPAGYANPLQGLVISPAPVTVQVTPDSQGFADLIKVTTSEQIGNEFRNQTLSIYGTTTSN